MLPLTIASLPRAMLHIDADAFFASCEQSRHPTLKGRPVVTGKERGVAASMSYEAKAAGVRRGMPLSQIRTVCPDAVLLPSDYETYSLLSLRLYNIVRRYTPDVEEYSIDECFADITGLQRPMRMNYARMAEAMKRDLDTELGFTFSVGLAPSKVVAKIASKWHKPSGLTIIQGRDLHRYLQHLSVADVWGIGAKTTAYLDKLGVHTALELARKDEAWVKYYFYKPMVEIWHELNGRSVIPLETAPKKSYQMIQKMKTFSPPSNDPAFVYAQLAKNIENACMKARRYNLAPQRVIFYLRTHDFDHRSIMVKLSRPTAFSHEILTCAEGVFSRIFHTGERYRSTGVLLTHLADCTVLQQDLFGVTAEVEKTREVYRAIDAIREKYGKHTVFLGSSFLAHQHKQHEGERGDAPERTRQLLKGETKRKRLGIPLFLGKVR
ncbi:MAG TPA: DNA polymerase IV [Gammaproteobacteria bacterium]|nr:DNA polymerase IV [Gammaproteobacteria bacterium]